MTKAELLSILRQDITDDEKAELILALPRIRELDEDAFIEAPGELHPAPEVEVIKTWLINDFHRHLRGCCIYCAFTDREESRNGRAMVASIGFPDRYPDLKGYDFILKVNRAFWDSLDLDLKMRKAVIDHELCHIRIEDGRYYLGPHEIGEFSGVIERHGAFTDHLKQIGRFLLSDLIADEEV
ncbi:MAG: hypothetical protein IBX64_09980 [Actinobacteria bacterium]|nr:hypothetical protein [Actinomycetota bacterium]